MTKIPTLYMVWDNCDQVFCLDKYQRIAMAEDINVLIAITGITDFSPRHFTFIKFTGEQVFPAPDVFRRSIQQVNNLI